MSDKSKQLQDIGEDDSFVKRKLRDDKFNRNSPFGKEFKKAVKQKRLFK